MPLDQGPTTVPDASAVINQQRILNSFVTNVSKMDPQGAHIFINMTKSAKLTPSECRQWTPDWLAQT